MSWIVDIGKAVAEVVRSFQLTRKEPPLKNKHFWVTKDGVRQCVYCHAPFAKAIESERCPFFT